MLQKNITFLQNESIKKDEIIKSLLEKQTSILETVSKLPVEEEKEEEGVSLTRNENIEEHNGRNNQTNKSNNLVKRIKTCLKIYTLETLV